jgi:hypothetical protein
MWRLTQTHHSHSFSSTSRSFRPKEAPEPTKPKPKEAKTVISENYWGGLGAPTDFLKLTTLKRTLSKIWTQAQTPLSLCRTPPIQTSYWAEQVSEVMIRSTAAFQAEAVSVPVSPVDSNSTGVVERADEI